ncbi:hypothetical protein EDB80DRAFT_755856 [Ilyonectria destructans]|nr:hypothetical protein EDB80DRAFT_755856 [Ilyonectria destructans]
MAISITFLLAGFWATSAVAFPFPTTPSFDWSTTNLVLAFGDSYSFVQGTEGHWAYSFIGDQLNVSFTPQQLLSNQIVPGQNTSSAGGPNWLEDLTGCTEGYPAKCDIQLWDFAFAGSDISINYTPLHHNFTVSYENQIQQWKDYAEDVLRVDTRKALVSSWIGINDISDSSRYKFPIYNASNFQELYTEMIHSQFAAIENVYAAGYKNFLFLNLPPLDKTPSAQISSNPLPNTAMITTWNSVLNETAKNFSASHPGTTAMVFDAYNWLTYVFDNAADFGITNTTSFCSAYGSWDIATNYAAYGCNPIYDYFWYNSGHITYHTHAILATKLKEFLSEELASGKADCET